MERKTHTINVAGKSLGRAASDIARILRGKNKPDFVPYKDIGDFVVVENLDKVKFTGKKLYQKIYFHHSGFLGGLKQVPLKRFFEKSPAVVLRKAVLGMMPKNKLRARQIKRLSIK